MPFKSGRFERDETSLSIETCPCRAIRRCVTRARARAGLCVFSILGYLSEARGVPIEEARPRPLAPPEETQCALAPPEETQCALAPPEETRCAPAHPEETRCTPVPTTE
jgi:hypothetical protein